MNQELPQHFNARFLPFIEQALREDLGSGDHTTLATIPKKKQATARLLVKDHGVLAGVELARRIFEFVDPDLHLDIYLEDGHRAHPDQVCFTVSGSARSILSTERIVLNCMQRMSGIATYTHRMVQHLEGTKTKLLDTRKTTPGIRFLEKWAVKIGGGENHRFGLYDMIMIKDNHVDAAGGITQAVERVQDYLREEELDLRIEVETRNMAEVQEALKAGAHRIMLDNFTPDQAREAVAYIDEQAETEASGGITEHNIRQYAETGVNYISSGALTHTAVPLDLSLKITSR